MDLKGWMLLFSSHATVHLNMLSMLLMDTVLANVLIRINSRSERLRRWCQTIAYDRANWNKHNLGPWTKFFIEYRMYMMYLFVPVSKVVLWCPFCSQRRSVVWPPQCMPAEGGPGFDPSSWHPTRILLRQRRQPGEQRLPTDMLIITTYWWFQVVLAISAQGFVKFPKYLRTSKFHSTCLIKLQVQLYIFIIYPIDELIGHQSRMFNHFGERNMNFILIDMFFAPQNFLI